MLLQILNRSNDLKIAAPNKAEKMQYRALKKAIENGRCTLSIDSGSFNKKYSPVYNVMENFVPLLVMIVLSLAVLVSTRVIFGIVAIMVSVMMYLCMFKPWAEKMLVQRVRILLLRNYYNFQYLWKFGEITLLLAKSHNIGCKSPDGDWKSFASLHFSDLMTITALPGAPPLPQMPKPEIEEVESEDEEALSEEDLFDFDELNMQ